MRAMAIAQPFWTALERLRRGGVLDPDRVARGAAHAARPPQPRGGRPRTRVVIAPEATSINVAAWAAQQPSHAWRHVAWRNGQNRPWAALFVAVRVTPVVLWRRKQRLHDVWLLCQRPLGATTASKHDKYFLSNLPATTPLRALVRAAHLGKARRTGIRGARGLITVFLFTSPRPVTGAGGEGTAAADHAYATGGVYDIRVRIDDDDANSHSGTTRAFVTGSVAARCRSSARPRGTSSRSTGRTADPSSSTPPSSATTSSGPTTRL